VLELFAGDGNFTRDLARVAAELTAVEGDRPAAARLRVNVGLNVGSNIERNVTGPARVVVAAEAALPAVRRFERAGERFDLMVLDPPRAGAAEIAPLLPSLTDRIVYVSCDPMTLARDARALAERGLSPLRATPLDLMPQTSHVETVCVFRRG
jgi:23S rRNA (uracil1939-C5)-methyltransferase